jgi:hypothetical protein
MRPDSHMYSVQGHIICPCHFTFIRWQRYLRLHTIPKLGAATKIRTPDIFITSEALYHLSYGGIILFWSRCGEFNPSAQGRKPFTVAGYDLKGDILNRFP